MTTVVRTLNGTALRSLWCCLGHITATDAGARGA